MGSVSHPVVLLKVLLEVDDIGVVEANKDVNLLEYVLSCVFVVTRLPPNLWKGHDLDGKLLPRRLVCPQLHHRKP